MKDDRTRDEENKKCVKSKAKDEGCDMKRINSVRELDVYKLGFSTAMEIFQLSKKFPVEERFSLT
ncbi:MAG: four helix bundle protein, partial [Candidatus Omnitrophota bacterium]